MRVDVEAQPRKQTRCGSWLVWSFFTLASPCAQWQHPVRRVRGLRHAGVPRKREMPHKQRRELRPRSEATQAYAEWFIISRGGEMASSRLYARDQEGEATQTYGGQPRGRYWRYDWSEWRCIFTPPYLARNKQDRLSSRKVCPHPRTRRRTPANTQHAHHASRPTRHHTHNHSLTIQALTLYHARCPPVQVRNMI